MGLFIRLLCCWLTLAFAMPIWVVASSPERSGVGLESMVGAGNLQKAILGQPAAGLVSILHTADSTNVWMNFSRATAGFPVGLCISDTVRRFPKYSLQALSTLGALTLISK